MAKYNFEEYEQLNPKQSGTNSKGVGYFNSLKNDGDEAIVRFAYTSPRDFEIVDVHQVQVDGNYRKVECLRSATDPISVCPLCQAGNKPQTKFYVKLLEYVKMEDGSVKPQATVWERTISMARKLKTFADEYGDLSQYIFKVKRSGEKGDLKTTYDIIPTNPVIYKQELYPADFSSFANFDLAHHSYYSRTAEELDSFIRTGVFPQGKKAEASAPAYQPNTAPVSQQDYDSVVTTTPAYTQQTPVQPTYTNPGNPAVQPAPQVQNVPTQTSDRPRRIYQY